MNIKSWSNINKTLNQRIIREDLCKINQGCNHINTYYY